MLLHAVLFCTGRIVPKGSKRNMYLQECPNQFSHWFDLFFFGTLGYSSSQAPFDSPRCWRLCCKDDPVVKSHLVGSVPIEKQQEPRNRKELDLRTKGSLKLKGIDTFNFQLQPSSGRIDNVTWKWTSMFHDGSWDGLEGIDKNMFHALNMSFFKCVCVCANTRRRDEISTCHEMNWNDINCTVVSGWF